MFDTLVVKDTLSKDAAGKLWAIWYETVELIASDPDAFVNFIADITDSSFENIKLELEGIKMLSEQDYLRLIANQEAVRNDLKMACMFARNDPQACEHYAQNLKIRTADAD